MKSRRWILKLFTLLTSMIALSAHAIYLDSTIYEMPSNKSFISKSIYNDSHKQNLYSIAAVKIDKPGHGGEKSSQISEGELLFAPLSFSLAPKSFEFFKIFYRGPEDNKERYYRILFREMPVTLFMDRQNVKESEVVPVIAMDTILIVRPRKLDFKFTIDEQSGVLKNTGNTFFKVIVQKGCDSNDDEATMLYLLPGETWKSNKINMNNKKFIVAMRKYVRLGSGCFASD